MRLHKSLNLGNKLKIVEEEADELVSIFTAALKTTKAKYKYKIPISN
jgi:hypothetical protein